jgi:nitrogen fixation protein NifX
VHFGLTAKRDPGGGQGCQMEDMGDDDGAGRDPLAERVGAISGSSILFTLGLSDLAAVRLHEQRVFPVKSERVRHIDDIVTQVQRLLRENPPLWVRRVMRGGGGRRLLLDEQSF